MVLLFQYNSYQGSAWFSSANAVTGKLYEWDANVETFFSLTKVNQELTQRNAYLEQEVQKLSDSLVSVTKDSSIYHRDQFALLRNARQDVRRSRATSFLLSPQPLSVVR